MRRLRRLPPWLRGERGGRRGRRPLVQGLAVRADAAGRSARGVDAKLADEICLAGDSYVLRMSARDDNFYVPEVVHKRKTWFANPRRFYLAFRRFSCVERLDSWCGIRRDTTKILPILM